MSITSYVIGQGLVNQANPNLDIYKASTGPGSSYWDYAGGTQPLQTFKAPQYQDATFQKFQQKAPTYQGMNGGDYNALQGSLQAPGEIAARQAYDQTRQRLNASASARGMYGSSNYTNQMVQQADQPYMDTLAQNAARAASQRYQMQQQDTQFAQQAAQAIWQALLGENTAANQLDAQNTFARNQYGYNAGLAETASENQARTYANQLRMGGYEDDWRRTLQQISEKVRLGNLISGFANSNDQYNDALKAQQISKMADSGNEGGLGGIMSGVGSLAGMALNFVPGLGSLGGVMNSANLGGQTFNTGLSGVTTGNLAGLNAPFL